MKRVTPFLLGLIFLIAGALTGELFSRTPATHRLFGQLFGRGELIAMVGHRGIFDPNEIADEVLRCSDTNVPVNQDELERAMFALRGEFDGDRNFAAALRANRIWPFELRNMIGDVFRGERSIEEKIALETTVPPDETKRYFDEHQPDFAQPLRIRPRHIFLAAPEGTENVEMKRIAMEEIMARLEGGEDFASLGATASEDEASKGRGGDLGFVAENRVPAEFWTAIENLPINGPPAMVQSHLGFHAVQILEVRPARMMTFEEARPEIEQMLASGKRRVAVEQMRERLARKALLVGR
jgi:parvulin-like peptidyl-prolyl isomerase